MPTYTASGTVVAVSVPAGFATRAGSSRAALGYNDFNVGVETVAPIPRVYQYVDFNIGLEPIDIRDDVEYTDFNVGLEPAPHIGSEYADFNIYADVGIYHRGVYLDFNIDPDADPVPHIWYIRPQYGPEGLLFNIIGMGFGTTQEEFGGIVKLGALTAPTTQWEIIPAESSKAIRAAGYAPLTAPDLDYLTHPYPYFTTRQTPFNQPAVNTVTLDTGDIIEFDYINRASTDPFSNEIHVIPYFSKLNASATSTLSWDSTPTLDALVDTDGVAWKELVDSANGELIHRRFIVPASFSGVLAGNWGVALYGESTVGRPARPADFARFVVRSTSGAVKMWVTLDDGSAPSFASSGLANWTQFGLVNSPLVPNFIADGATNVEHEWVIAIVPDDAVSGMVKIVLEDLP